MGTLVLTDDETVALALLAGRPWPAMLPSIDIEKPEQIVAAGRRGLRSLAVRELLTSTGGDEAALTPELAALSAAVLAKPVQATSYAATEDLTWLPGGLTTVFYGDDAEQTWTTQVIAADGVSYFSAIEAAAARNALTALARGAAQDGFEAPAVPDGSPPHWYCIGRGRLVMAVTKEDIRLLRLDPGTDTFVAEPFHGSEVADAETLLWSDTAA